MKKVISFLVWGNNPKYTYGAIENAKLVQLIYGPQWIGRFYCAKSVPESIINQLQELPNTEIIHMKEDSNWLGLFWRFYPSSDNDVDIMLSRDADSRLSIREKEAVDEWLDSNKGFHIMRDHPYHFAPIMGGMWGCRKQIIPEIKELISNYHTGNYWQTDQKFLRDVIYPIIKDNCVVHDSFFKNEDFAKPFPQKRKKPEFVGQVFDYKNCSDKNSYNFLKQHEKNINSLLQ